MFEIEMIVGVSCLVVSSIILVSILLMQLARNLSKDSGLNQQIIVTVGEVVGNTPTSSVKLFSSEMEQLQTIIGENVHLKRVSFQDVISGEVHVIEFYNQLIVGRVQKGSDGSFIVNREGVSRSHSRIFCSDGNYYIEDLNSLNHTYINGMPVSEPRILYAGYRVTFGASNYIFSY